LQARAGPAYSQTCSRARASTALSRACTCRGEDFVQVRPQHSPCEPPPWRPWRCVIVAGPVPQRGSRKVTRTCFLPGSSFLEKDGTFTNAERRVSRVRKSDGEPLARLPGLGKSPVLLSKRARLSDALTTHPFRDHGGDRASHADLQPASPTRSSTGLGSIPVAVQRGRRPRGTTDHARAPVSCRGKGQVPGRPSTCPPASAPPAAFPLILTTGRIT